MYRIWDCGFTDACLDGRVVFGEVEAFYLRKASQRDYSMDHLDANMCLAVDAPEFCDRVHIWRFSSSSLKRARVREDYTPSDFRGSLQFSLEFQLVAWRFWGNPRSSCGDASMELFRWRNAKCSICGLVEIRHFPFLSRSSGIHIYRRMDCLVAEK